MIAKTGKFVAMVIAAGLMLGGCSSSGEKSAEAGGMAGGLTWTAPASWTAGPEQQMRAKTYIIKAVDSDHDDAECAVFYFGHGQGGDRESNLERWIGQFEQADGRPSADLASISESEVNGLKVTTIELPGIYHMSGPMMELKEKKLGYYLMGAIVEGPNGSVFFKMVGPEKTVMASRDDFTNLLKSIRASGA